MRVLITGITGMAGSHLCDYLLSEQQHCQIFGVKRWRSNTENIDHLLRSDRLQLIDTDLTDLSGCTRLIEIVRPDIIFHLAANSFVPDSWVNPQRTIHDNIGMQLNLFEAVRTAKIDPIIQIACSSEQYGKVYANELPICEKNPFRPLSPYGVSKVGQDVLAYQYFQSFGLRTVRTIAFNHEGPRRGEVFATSSFAKQIAEIEAKLISPVIHVGNLTAQRDWSDVRDVVRAYWLAVTAGEPGESYIVASGKARTVSSMLDYLLSLSKVKIEIREDPKRLRPSDLPVLHGCPAKFIDKTGWSPTYSFEQTLADLLSYWRGRTVVSN